MSEILFRDLALNEELQAGIADAGFETPTPIQAQAIPVLLAGGDVTGLAQTGTGKTAAFGLPILNELDLRPGAGIQALILCPTRELALQVATEIRKLGRNMRSLRIASIYGGESYDKQFRALEDGPQIVVGAPGRVIDHIQRGTIKLDRVRSIVLDEADEMLNMGFREDIELIMSYMPEERQTVLFSATMSREIHEISRRYQNEPVLVEIKRQQLTTPNIQQYYFQLHPRNKAEALARLLEFYNFKLVMVFCNTKKMVDDLVEDLSARGLQAEGLHGDLRQSQRNNVMAKFRNKACSILVATDVAARGIDVDNVEAVFNYDLPNEVEYYVHRIGRTARAGKNGMSFSFVGSRDVEKLEGIRRYTKAQITKSIVPTPEDLRQVRRQRLIDEVLEASQGEGIEDLLPVAAQILEACGGVAETAIAAMARLIQGEETESSNNVIEELTVRGKYADRDGKRGFERNDRQGGGRFERGGDRGGRFDRGGDRPGFGGRAPREERAPRTSDVDMVKLTISIGRQNQVRPGDIVGAIAGEVNLPGRAIGQIDIYDRHSVVEVPRDKADRVISIMNRSQIKGRKINVGVAEE